MHTGEACPLSESNCGATALVERNGNVRSFGFMLLASVLLFATFVGEEVHARSDASEFSASLKGDERKAFDDYFKAWTFYNAEKDAFWAKVSSVRKARRKKRRSGKALSSQDYVDAFPPAYDGPKLSKSLTKRWADFRAKKRIKDKKPRRELPGVSDFLANAKRYYNFVPERISEREFKERYAREALRLGLSKEQVVRVYALETGGNGTADMQAGIHPISKKGRPISSALGYAQLLNANSVNEVVKHGSKFVARLQNMLKNGNLSDKRATSIRAKITALRKMTRKAKSVPNKWSEHMKLGRSGPGMGIHAINLDGDIGPWLQVIKLKGIKNIAERKGRTNLASHELELMNLAGPGTGLEMMTAVGLKMPTVNFFSRRGYERNSIVRGNTSTQLLDALKERMNYNVKNKGAIEFNAVFDQLLAQARN